MTSRFIEIACPPQNRTVRAYGEGRCLGARAASFPQSTIRLRNMPHGCPSRDDRATQDVGGWPNVLTRGDRSWLQTMLTIN